MGKRGGKSKKSLGQKLGESNLKQKNSSENSARAYDKDTAVFILMAQELKEEGNRCFQTRDYEGAMLIYEKAIKLLPRNHVDVSYLRSNMAECHMQLGITEYPRAIHECNLALEVTPKHSKALLKRARCYEALDKLDLAVRDVGTVLKMEPNNLMAIEIAERVNRTIEIQGLRENKVGMDSVLLPEYFEPPPLPKARKKKGSKAEEKKINKKEMEINTEERKVDVDVVMEEKKAEDKLVVEEEKVCNAREEELRRSVKLVLGEDIRWAQIPINCDVLKLREVVSDRFPTSKGVLVKYRDQEGDLVTITKTEELRLAEASAENGSVKLYIVEVNPDQDPFFNNIRKDDDHDMESTGGKRKIETACLNDWIIQFAQLFKNNVGFDTDAYLDLHEVGKKLYSDAMEETVTSDEAQDLFCGAAEKFQEMTALALFNWGNVHMSRARKRVYFTEDSDSSRETVLTQVKSAYEWAVMEYENAGKKYEEALKIKSNFYEAVLALGQQQFEQAKLSWYYAIGANIDLKSWPYAEVLQLYNRAEENLEKGLQMWEDNEEQRVNELTQSNKIEQKMKLNNLFKHVSADEAAERASNIRAQIHVLWGTMLYERSIMEFKLGLPVWHECLEIAVEKFELAGASRTDIAVMIKNHCSNDTASEGLGFNIDEIVQAWNEMDEAKRWQSSIQSFRLEPLLRRRVSKIYYALEHA